MTSQLDDEQPLSVINAISVSAPLTEGLNAQRNRGARARWCGRVNTTTPNAYPNVIQPNLRSTLSFPPPGGRRRRNRQGRTRLPERRTAGPTPTGTGPRQSGLPVRQTDAQPSTPARADSPRGGQAKLRRSPTKAVAKVSALSAD